MPKSIKNHLHYITHVEPEMFDTTKIVISKIMNKWENIAEALLYDLATIKIKNVKIQRSIVESFSRTGWRLTIMLRQAQRYGQHC